MRIAVYSSKAYEKPFLESANADAGHDLVRLDARLSAATADLARGVPAVALFVGDDASAPVLRALHAGGTRLLALRSAGFNHVNVAEAERLGLTVARVPAYSPYAVAEHAVGLMLTLNRKFHRAYARVREQNFALDGLMGFDMHGKTAGVIGTGKIGEAVCAILRGFGCRVLAFDPVANPACEALGVEYATLADLYASSDIITLHCPLTPATRHLIDAAALAAMKPGVMLINTSRGAVVDTRALIAALKRGHIGSVGLDVYEEEGDLFFQDLSAEVIHDDVFVRLLTFPNVVITAHQGFFTREACEAIARTTIDNLTGFERAGGAGVPEANRVSTRLLKQGLGADASACAADSRQAPNPPPIPVASESRRVRRAP
jgi:D-lactate dehydrogenase